MAPCRDLRFAPPSHGYVNFGECDAVLAAFCLARPPSPVWVTSARLRRRDAFRFGILLQAMPRLQSAVRCVVTERFAPFKGNNGIFDPVTMKESDAKNAMGAHNSEQFGTTNRRALLL